MMPMSKRASVLATLAVTAAVLLCLPTAAWGATEREPNNDYATATPIKVGQTMQGTLKYPDADYFRIQLPEGLTYECTFSVGDPGLRHWDLLMFEQWFPTNATGRKPVAIPYDGSSTQYTRPFGFSEAGGGSIVPTTIDQYFSKGTLYLKLQGKPGRGKIKYKLCIKPHVDSSLITKVSPKKKSVVVKFKKVKGVARYQIRYSQYRTMKKSRTINVKASKSSCTIKKLKSKKTYYFQVRTAKKVGGKLYYSDWYDGRNGMRALAKVK